MFDDLTGAICPADLEQEIKNIKEVLKDTRDIMRNLKTENDILKRNFAEAYTDAQGFSEHIKELHERINDEGLENMFDDLEIPE